MRRHRLIYTLICLVLGAIGFSIGMAFIPEKWINGRTKNAEIVRFLFFQAGGVEEGVLKSGWSLPESWGTWSDGPKSILAISFHEPHSGDLLLEFDIQPYFAEKDRSQRVEVSVNGTKVDTWTLTSIKVFRIQNLRVTKSIWDSKRPAEIEFIYSKPRSPLELGRGKDRRRLALGLKALTIRDLF